MSPTQAPTEEDPWEATGDDWETAATSIGEKIDWRETPQFRGIFIRLDTTATEAGEELPILSFKDTNGQDRFAWLSPDLRTAFKHIPPLSQVQITHLGKEDIGRGRTVNRFDVKYKAPAEG
jgi:hypothetical protein